MSIMSGSDFLVLLAGTSQGRLSRLLSRQLNQGLDQRQLAFALALGISIGLLPSVWGASILCCALAAWFGLNQAVVQLANYMIFPLQILLFVPYFKLGNALFDGQALPENLTLLLSQMQTAPLETMTQLWWANLLAIAAWLLTTPVLLIASFQLCLFLMKRLAIPKKNAEIVVCKSI